MRLYAEDPTNNFLPDIGRLQVYRRPQGPGVRVDDGFEEGMDIPIYYDPMIAKLCTYGKDREEAIDRMIRAIDDYDVVGVANTLSFGRFVMQHEAFRSGQFDTHFVNRHFKPEMLQSTAMDEVEVAALFGALHLAEKKRKATTTPDEPTTLNRWKSTRGRHL